MVGLGEIGKPILQIISKNALTIGYDINPKLMDNKKYLEYQKLPTRFLHICIPFAKNFITNVISLNEKFQPECMVIHSTIRPGTTSILQQKLSIPVMYSATRGVHKRMIHDLKRYTKFYAIEQNAPRSLGRLRHIQM